jgi:L-fuconolactonase
MADAGVGSTVLGPGCATDAETDFLLEDGGELLGGGGGRRLGRSARRRSAGAHRGPRGKSEVQGLRPMLQSDPDARWILDREAAPSLDAMERLGPLVRRPGPDGQLPIVAQLAAARPGLPIVIDHAGKPPIASGELEAWRGLIERCAAGPTCSARSPAC